MTTLGMLTCVLPNGIDARVERGRIEGGVRRFGCRLVVNASLMRPT